MRAPIGGCNIVLVNGGREGREGQEEREEREGREERKGAGTYWRLLKGGGGREGRDGWEGREGRKRCGHLLEAVKMY